MDHVLAGQVERADKVCTGRMEEPYPYREGKRLVAERLAAEEGLDLGTSFMYGDSPGDLPVLETVGHPRVVNPIRGMVRIARRRDWPILQWH